MNKIATIDNVVERERLQLNAFRNAAGLRRQRDWAKNRQTAPDYPPCRR
jgi:hypothetical protein